MLALLALWTAACLEEFPSPPVATDPSGWRDGPKQFGQLVRAILAQVAVAAPAFFGARPPAVDRRGAMGRGWRNRVRRGSKSSKPTPSIAPRLRVRHEPKARPAVRRAAPLGDAAPGAAQVAARTNVGSLPIGWDVIFDPESNEWYYWDSVNMEASWEHPCSLPADSNAGQAPGHEQSAASSTGGAGEALVLSSGDEAEAGQEASQAASTPVPVRAACSHARTPPKAMPSVAPQRHHAAGAAAAGPTRAPRPSATAAGLRRAFGAKAAQKLRPSADPTEPPLRVGAIGASQAFLAAKARDAQRSGSSQSAEAAKAAAPAIMAQLAKLRASLAHGSSASGK